MANVFDFCRPPERRTVPPCTVESHAALKADASRWNALKSIGAPYYEFPDGTSEMHDMRNCPACGSTLVKVAR